LNSPPPKKYGKRQKMAVRQNKSFAVQPFLIENHKGARIRCRTVILPE